MKKLLIITFSLMIVFNFSNCSKKNDEPSTPPVTEAAYDVLIYEPNNFSREYKSDQLQATVKKSDMQFSTFGDVNTGTALGAFNKAYVYNTVENKESFMLFDDMGEPAFLYQIDLATGEKKPSVVEFQREDANNFYVRFFYYDWTNRLGTLLFETMITKNGDNYVSNPTFTIENFDTKSTDGVKSGNTSFPVKLARFEELMLPMKSRVTLKNTNGGIEEWKASFDNMRNSTIADWLVFTRKAGAVLTLTGLGVSETVIGAPAGVWLVAGGSTLIVASTAIEVVLTDKWSNFITETQTKIETLTETATKIGDNMVQKFQGYSHDLKDHWVNTNTTKTSLVELTTFIEEEEIIVDKDDLNDLPNKDGVLQIGLSWNTDDTDVDLWVTDPSGEKIYYSNTTSASGGYLDRDDTNGFGPENIYWVDNIPDGNYLIQVHYYSGDPATGYQVKVTNGLGFSATFNGTLMVSDQVDNVATISKFGSQLSY
ncbi:MAG: hypothetical protein CVT99_03330 [Bacteroidetes bacterium HGW-Bacteroidetes-16]|jgi:hypothetical protein|nr:MAG: hypothetical protein CVT99_03330 [Bacteroidetes bacterium HGW-Bacteroidetes-16]